jgi:hypothetical protein
VKKATNLCALEARLEETLIMRVIGTRMDRREGREPVGMMNDAKEVTPGRGVTAVYVK